MLLVLESSANYPSICLIDKSGEIVHSVCIQEEKAHAEMLPLLIEGAMTFLGNNGLSLEAVALNQGPGSYTGLRIGTSLVKGLCYGLSLPLIGVNGLEAMARFALSQFPNKKRAFAMLDARRDEVYVQILDKKGELTAVTAQIIIPETWDIDVPNDVFIGNANQKAMDLLNITNIASIEGPIATQLAMAAFESWQAKKFKSVAYFEPFYLKEFQAGISKKFAL